MSCNQSSKKAQCHSHPLLCWIPKVIEIIAATGSTKDISFAIHGRGGMPCMSSWPSTLNNHGKNGIFIVGINHLTLLSDSGPPKFISTCRRGKGTVIVTGIIKSSVRLLSTILVLLWCPVSSSTVSTRNDVYFVSIRGRRHIDRGSAGIRYYLIVFRTEIQPRTGRGPCILCPMR